MNILSIDPAQLTGWATLVEEKLDYGLWDFKLKRDENFAYKLLSFEAKFTEKVKSSNIQLVVFERVSGINSAAIMSHSKFVCIIEMYCTKNDIPFKGYSAPSIKKFATGKGNSKKQEMIKAAIRKFGYRGKDDNVADAICLLNLAITEI